MFNEELGLSPDVTRVIAVVLTETEWRALLAVEPEPVAWLQQLVKARLRLVAEDADSNARPYELLNDPALSSDRLAV